MLQICITKISNNSKKLLITTIISLKCMLLIMLMGCVTIISIGGHQTHRRQLSSCYKPKWIYYPSVSWDIETHTLVNTPPHCFAVSCSFQPQWLQVPTEHWCKRFPHISGNIPALSEPGGRAGVSSTSAACYCQMIPDCLTLPYLRPGG